MPSPDLTNYVDLQLRDFDPQDIFEVGLTNLALYLENFTAREGQIEVILLEAIAQQIAELIFAINRLPSAIFESLLTLYGITRDFGAPPVADLQFDVATAEGLSIPAGTQAILNLDNGLEPIVFTTNEELVIPPGQTTGVVQAIGDRYTSDANGYPAVTLLELLDSLTYVDYVRLSTSPTLGRETEDDIDFFNRGAQRLQRLVTTLVLPSQFSAAALELSDVERAFGIDNYDPAGDGDHNGPVGEDAGYMTVAVYGENEFLSGPRKTEIKDILQTQSIANLTVNVIDPVITPVNVTVTIRVEATADEAQTISAVEDAVSQYLDPMVWEWGSVVRRNELISLINNVAGVDYVDNLSIPAANVTLTGPANLTSAGTISVDLVED